MSGVTNIQDLAHFQRSLSASNAPKMAYFYEPWSEPCKSFSKDFAEVSNRYADRVDFLSIDVDKCKDVASNFTVIVMPTLILFKGNEQLASVQGANWLKLTQLVERITYNKSA